MYLFLWPLLTGFASHAASSFTTFYSQRWGPHRGVIVSFILRNVLGLPLWAGGFVMAIRLRARPFWNPSIWVSAAGSALLLCGALIILLALTTLRIRAARPHIQDDLAETGLYGHLRHPIHAGTLLEFAGIFLLFPSRPVATAFVLGLMWIWIQSILEERDLLQRLPAYRDYMNRVPRFFIHFPPVPSPPSRRGRRTG
jgi:protein-S-isoprenylcysteine O-methyltransferase Ste14